MIKELNDLHEEFKNIGPAPKEEQEILWQRFKAASDKIYEARRKKIEEIKVEQEENYLKKVQICEEIEKYNDFESDKITDWNQKTKELLALQKQWDAIGNLSREKAKDISKRFWAAFKHFFNKKNEFFRKLEEFREQNLQEKIKLCEEAEALKDSEEYERTSERLKVLQLKWKEVGPVPEKQRNAVFDRFKEACDHFFNRKRGKNKVVEDEYEQNLNKKSVICDTLEKMTAEKTGTMQELKRLQSEYNSIGFVPRKDMDRIRKRYSEATEAFF
ncbi:MAG: DUF349 domain-containing protein, partial [Verrucomicrobia bacterium]|nr:DUF349 domain-containing protein [Cytophagales bacterium]